MCHPGGRAGWALPLLSAVLLDCWMSPRGGDKNRTPSKAQGAEHPLLQPLPHGRILSFSFSSSPGVELDLLPPKLPGATRWSL